jgi:glycosyltransferase involved in cell wall biosynthesis
MARRLVRRLPSPVRAAVARRPRLPARIKVSIIIAAYNSDQQRLERLLASLAKQSMPAREFEVLFVDDGSTDDTYSRLLALAGSRPNVAVHTIPNSGWAGRPRNVGIGLARGRYLLFMDHDDELFPRALERAYDYGHRHRADVVSAKEVRTAGWSWGWDCFTGDIPRAARHEVNPLIPMTPHKLYRRDFVREQGVLFPEAARSLWEDIYFNVSAYARGARVAVLSSYPFYHWVSTEENNSSTFGEDAEEFWSKLAALFDFIDSELAGVQGRADLLAHHLRIRVLNFLGPSLLERSDSYREVAYRYAGEIVAKHAPPHLDGALSAVDRCRIAVLRSSRPDLQHRLAECDQGVTAVPVLEDVSWDGPELVLRVSTTLVDGAGDPIRLRRDGDRWLRTLPDDFAAALPAEALDVTDELAQASFDVSVKGRSSRSTWRLPGTGGLSCSDDGTGTGTITGTVTARFDPVAFAAEHDLTDPVWDFAARLSALGYIAHRGLRGGSPVTALLGGVAAVGYTNRDGVYSLDVAAAVRTITGTARPAASDARVTAQPGPNNALRVEVTLAMPAVHCVGQTRLDGEVLLGDSMRVPATLASEGGEGGGVAVLRFEAAVHPGDYPLRTYFLERTGGTGLVLSASGSTARVAPEASGT